MKEEEGQNWLYKMLLFFFLQDSCQILKLLKRNEEAKKNTSEKQSGA